MMSPQVSLYLITVQFALMAELVIMHDDLHTKGPITESSMGQVYGAEYLESCYLTGYAIKSRCLTVQQSRPTASTPV